MLSEVLDFCFAVEANKCAVYSNKSSDMNCSCHTQFK